MKYIIEFTKSGNICYTSHLDIMKVFKRAFKRAGIGLAHSKGYNPHPKMAFAQPLSLSYWSMQEYIDFETDITFDAESGNAERLIEDLRAEMPEGIELLRIIEAGWLKKSLAAANTAAEYVIGIPVKCDKLNAQELWDKYMLQDRIMTPKKQKKNKEEILVDIKPKIKEIIFKPVDEELFIIATLDSGSSSNLSPELLIRTVNERLELGAKRQDISVMRRRLLFNAEVQNQLASK